MKLKPLLALSGVLLAGCAAPVAAPGPGPAGATAAAALPTFSGAVADVRTIAKVDEAKLPGGDGKMVRLHDGYTDINGKVQSAKYWMFEAEMQPDASKFTLNTAVPLYMFMDKDGKQVGRNVIGVVPGDPGYSPYWQVFAVKVPSGYVPNSIRSIEDVQAALKTPGFEEKPMPVAVNCPVVAEGTKLEGATDKAADLCWYKGKRSFYFAFDTLKITSGKVPIAPIWVLMPKDADPMAGTPNAQNTTQAIANFDKAKANPMPFLNQNQDGDKFELVNNIIDTWPSSDNPANPLISTPDHPEKSNYSGMWLVTRVNVPDNYAFRSVTTKAGLTKEAGFEVLPMPMLVNCPLLETLQR